MRIRSGRLAALATSIAFVIGVSGTTVARADVSPIFPANRPTPLIGAVNGKVPMSRLIHVVPNCIAAREAGPSLARIFALARESKVPLGADQCYRPLSQQ